MNSNLSAPVDTLGPAEACVVIAGRSDGSISEVTVAGGRRTVPPSVPCERFCAMKPAAAVRPVRPLRFDWWQSWTRQAVGLMTLNRLTFGTREGADRPAQ